MTALPSVRYGVMSASLPMRVAIVAALLACVSTGTALGQSSTFASGTVVDEAGIPIVGANVCHAVTDSSGHFAVSIARGADRRITVTADGFDPAEQVVTVPADQPAFGLAFVLHRTAGSSASPASDCALGFELESQLPEEAGWRGARWGMTVQEVANAFGARFAEDKRAAKDRSAKVAQRGHLKSRVPLDGFE